MANQEHINWLLEGVESWNKRRKQSDFLPDFDGANLAAIFRQFFCNNNSIYFGASLEGINLQKAFLRNTNLSQLNLRGADLTDAMLQGSSLASADLRRATLVLANLSGAILLAAKLNGVEAGGADFSGANLSGACLDEANLQQARFAGASLVSASIKKADLRRSVLVGADLTSTRPWETILYDNAQVKPTEISPLPDRVGGVGELIDVVGRLTQRCNPPESDSGTKASFLYFRGEALHTWKLKPSAVRPPSSKQPDVRGREGRMLLDLMSRRPGEFSQMKSALSQWVLAQHHGLKTRLLDITRNPLVALFSACDDSFPQHEFGDKDGVLHAFIVPRHIIKSFDSDSISVVTNFAKLPLFEQEILLGKHEEAIRTSMLSLGQEPPIGFYNRYQEVLIRLYHYIGQEKPHFRERIDPRDFYKVFVVEPEQSLERVRAQSAAFLISAFHQRFEPSHILAWNPDIPIYEHYRFKIPALCKGDILRELRLLNVTRETLFPGLEEATQAVMRQHGRKEAT